MTAQAHTTLSAGQPPSGVRWTIPRAALAGLGLGLAWGVAARIWMRLISTEHEFSWSGTGMIIGAMAVGGLVLGFLYGVRSAGRSRWWRLLAVVWLVILAGPGTPFLPAFLLGGLIWLQRTWIRAVGAAVLLANQVGFWLLMRGEIVNPWALYGGFLLLSLTLSAGSAEIFRPRGRASDC
ncbi:hypothetical protein EV651_103350 [Kribbella sp. VKM Ac-2571]|uniref:hypothetical protein n=1 Tax=Kribbella sp. VKM Ac-2571 TaxID=2512222 RepID=UPI00105D8931|nr:hypothetical protein [Kribbella sp. VKM Ac-2571]TDO67438.1 hypothetical protein EV651_103350 [Kribbella sp. VKM Ac-2571]